MMNTKKKVRDEFVDERLADLQNRLSAMLEQTKEAYDIPIKKQAKNMGVSDTNLTKYTQSRADFDNPEKKPPKMGVDKLIRICEYFDVSADYMLGLTSDPKLVRRHIPDEAAIKQMCEYTGLTRQAIEALHKKKDDLLFSAGLTYLLSTKNNLLISIIEYILTCLHDVASEDERYSLLPGISSALEAGKYLFYDVFEELPQARTHFYQQVIKNDVIRDRYAQEMAMKCVDHEKVFQDLYPYVPYREDLTPEECSALDRDIRNEIIPEGMVMSWPPELTEKMYPQNETSNLTQEQTMEDVSLIDDAQYKYDCQCEAFWKEYYSRIVK